MISGSWSSSFREAMQGAAFCSETEKTELSIVAGPVSQGSMRMVKEPGNRPGERRGATGGEKVSRKAVSPLRDCKVRDMAVETGDDDGGRHSEARGKRE
jgi:hypothetical protein